MHDFIIVLGESPSDAMRRKAAARTVRALQAHIASIEDDEVRATASALLDLATAAANCLAQSDPGTLDTAGFWEGRPPATSAHIHAAVVRLAMAHAAGTAGALECIEDVNTVIRDMVKAG